MLRFYAREDQLVRETGIHPRIGDAARYYGRKFDTATRGYPAISEAFAVAEGGEDAPKCMKACRKGALWPADEATASACGVKFVPVECVDGAWVAKTSKPASKAEKAAS
jgi:hypothetical protein